MPSRLVAVFVSLIGLPLVIHLAEAQPATLPFPRLYTVMPIGGKAGTSVRVVVSGLDLEGVDRLVFGHPGLVATRVPDPAKPGEFLANQFEVRIAANVPPGLHEVRAVGQFGISNPRVFVVGDLPETAETEPNDDVGQAQKVDLNCVINGIVARNVDVDYFRFSGKKGQHVVVHCAAGSVDSRLDPELELLSGDGQSLARNWRWRGTDARLGVILPADGDYLVRLCQHAHIFGDSHHYYRLKLTTGPWLEAAWPNVLTLGQVTPVTLWGRNLPGGVADPSAVIDGTPLEKLEVLLSPPEEAQTHPGLHHRDQRTASQIQLDAFEHRVSSATGTSNPVLLMSSPRPVVLSQGENLEPAKAQPVTVPCEISGRFTQAKAGHWFVFEGKANEVVWIEGFADRVLSPLDLWFEVRRADNQQVVAEVDDHPEAFAPARFFARTEDPKGRIVLPADGKYLLQVGHRGSEHEYGPQYVYRVSLRRDQPDFRVLLLDRHVQSPGAIQLAQASSRHAEVYVHRLDGFAGPITLRAEGLPPGVTAPPQIVPAGVNFGIFTFTVAEQAPPSAATFRLMATGQIGERLVEREVRAGAMVWPNPGEINGAVAWSRVCQQLALAVGPAAPFSVHVNTAEVGVPVGGVIPLRLEVRRRWPEANVPVVIAPLSIPPNAVFNGNNQPVTVPPNATTTDITIQIPANVPPAEYSLQLIAQAGIPYHKDPNNKQKPAVTVQEACPPVKVVVYNKVAALEVNQSLVQVKAGGSAELLVAVRRLHGFRGPLEVALVPPSGNQAAAAAPARLAADQERVVLVLRSPPFTPPTPAAPFVVRATASMGNLNLVSEVPVQVAVVRARD